MSEFFKKKNSIGILYLNRRKAELNEVVEVSRKIDLPLKDVYGVQQVGPSKIVVKLMDHSSDLFEKTMKKFENEVLVLQERNVNIQIINLSLNKVVITIRNVPFEFPEYVLKSILSEYGHVYNIRAQTYTSGPLNGILNGNRTALMTLRKPIPSSLVFEGVMFMISYRGQLRTCLKCGFSGHLAAHCTANQWELINRLNEEDFPELRKRKEVPVESNDVDQAITNHSRDEKSKEPNVAPIDSSDLNVSSGDQVDNLTSDLQETRIDDIPVESKITEDVDTSSQCEPSAGKEKVPDTRCSPDGFQNSIAVAQVHGGDNENERSKVHNNIDSENGAMAIDSISDSVLNAAMDDLDKAGCLEGRLDLDLLENVVNDEVLVEETTDKNVSMEEDMATKGQDEVYDTSKDDAELEPKDSGDFHGSGQESGSSKGKWHIVMKRNKKENTAKKVYPARKKTNEPCNTDRPRSVAKRKQAAVEMYVNETVKMSKVKSKSNDRPPKS